MGLHYPDMNHDGKVTPEDSFLFHEMMDAAQPHGTGHRPSSDSSDFFAEILARVVLLILPVGYLLLLFNGVFPINGFTSILALLSLVWTIAGLFCKAK